MPPSAGQRFQTLISDGIVEVFFVHVCQMESLKYQLFEISPTRLFQELKPIARLNQDIEEHRIAPIDHLTWKNRRGKKAMKTRQNKTKQNHELARTESNIYLILPNT